MLLSPSPIVHQFIVAALSRESWSERQSQSLRGRCHDSAHRSGLIVTVPAMPTAAAPLASMIQRSHSFRGLKLTVDDDRSARDVGTVDAQAPHRQAALAVSPIADAIPIGIGLSSAS